MTELLVLAGSYFGDRCSPMSTSALLVSSLTHTDLFSNLKTMVRTSLVPFLITCVIYGAAGMCFEVHPDTSGIQSIFAEHFVLHPLALVPAIVILVFSLFKVNVKISCNQTLTIMLTHSLCGGTEPDAERMASHLENTAVVVAPLIPWSIAGAVPLASVGAPMLCIVTACYLYLLPVCNYIAESSSFSCFRKSDGDMPHCFRKTRLK